MEHFVPTSSLSSAVLSLNHVYTKRQTWPPTIITDLQATRKRWSAALTA